MIFAPEILNFISRNYWVYDLKMQNFTFHYYFMLRCVETVKKGFDMETNGGDY